MMPFIEQYLAVRRAAGFKLDSVAHRLRRFGRFADDRGDTVSTRQPASPPEVASA